MNNQPPSNQKPQPPMPRHPMPARAAAPVKPVAKPFPPAPKPPAPAAKPTVPIAKPLPPQPRPMAGKPVARKPTAAAPSAPPISDPELVYCATESGSSFAKGALLILALLAVCGGAWWYFSHLQPPAPRTVISASPVPVEEKPAPTPERRAVPVIAAPVPETKPVASAETPQPATVAPLPNTPVAPKPAPSAPDPFEGTLVLDATAARSAGAEERAARLLRTALSSNGWTKYLAMLRRSLDAELGKSPDFESPQRYDRYTANPFFMRAMLQFAIGSMTADDARKVISENESTRQLVTWVFESPEAMESFLRVATPRDDLRRVFETWASIAADDTEALGKYRELAIACSVVLEKPRDLDWNGKKFKITGAERYRWYKAKDKARQLATRITDLTAWQLAWVVGVPVPESEMEWAITELGGKLTQKNWGNAYGMVPYDMQKAVTGKMKVPYDYYTFAEILKKGGICGDRAYFAANTARSVGIPAVSISGDGPGGPHAWIAWLADEDRWAFSGRMDGYPAGNVSDPRNGSRISEQRFTRLSDSHAPSVATELRAQHLVWIHELQGVLGQTKDADFALDFAFRASPHSAELWERKIAWWKSQLPPPAASVWKPFLDKLRREFRDDTDMIALAREAEDQYVLAKLDVASAKNELRGDVRDLAKLKGLTALDEILSAHKRYAEVLARTNDYPGIRRVYREALDDYGREPAKFKALANDYWSFLTAAPPEVRKTACRDIEGAYERHVETKTGSYFDVKSQNTAAALVERFWREVGETARADRIQKALKKRGDKATEAAL